MQTIIVTMTAISALGTTFWLWLRPELKKIWN